MKVWVVQQGSYSDRGIVAVMSTKEKADALVEWLDARNSYDPSAAEEWDVDAHDPAALPALPCFMVQAGTDGITVEEVTPAPTLVGLTDINERNKVYAYESGRANVTVFADDEDHARRIAADLFREFKARNQ